MTQGKKRNCLWGDQIIMLNLIRWTGLHNKGASINPISLKAMDQGRPLEGPRAHYLCCRVAKKFINNNFSDAPLVHGLKWGLLRPLRHEFVNVV